MNELVDLLCLVSVCGVLSWTNLIIHLLSYRWSEVSGPRLGKVSQGCSVAVGPSVRSQIFSRTLQSFLRTWQTIDQQLCDRLYHFIQHNPVSILSVTSCKFLQSSSVQLAMSQISSYRQPGWYILLWPGYDVKYLHPGQAWAAPSHLETLRHEETSVELIPGSLGKLV